LLLSVIVCLLIIIVILVWGRFGSISGRDSTAAVVDYTTNIALSLGEYRENSPHYHFTNPLLFTETDQKQFTEYDNFDRQISDYVKSSNSARFSDSISVYLRDMNSGHWTGYNEADTFEPSSMLKVAVAISYYRKAVEQSDATSESVDSFLAKQLFYPGPDDTGQNYPPVVHLKPGYYSYMDLITDMIENSDNVATDLLVKNNNDEFNKVYKDFRLPPPVADGADDYMTARSYSVIFRTLYNSTYLPWDYSEEVLRLLASTTFTNGLVAGVPSGTVVSHKFGEHSNAFTNGTVVSRELHDCGIVYYPGRPYFICVMTKGHNFKYLEKVIADISKLAYKYVAGFPTQTQSNR